MPLKLGITARRQFTARLNLMKNEADKLGLPKTMQAIQNVIYNTLGPEIRTQQLADEWRCKKHPKYKAIREPKVDCRPCWDYFYKKNW